MKTFFSTILFMMVISHATAAPVTQCSADGSAVQEKLSGNIQKALDELVPQGVLGAVLAVEMPDQQRVVLTTGFADGDRKTPITADYAFQIGSQSKVFTAVAILMLAHQGYLDLSEPVAKYVRNMPGDEKATIRHLLNHTSGFGDGIKVLDASADLPRVGLTFDDMTLLSRIDGQHSNAGDIFQYNNFAYDILGVIIEKVSGKSYDQYIKQNILRPLGLGHTFSASRLPWPKALLAHGYTFDGREQKVVDATGPRDLSWASSAGDMISTTDDMMAWINALIDRKNLLGVSLTDMISEITPVPAGGEMIGYGYGLMQRRFAGITTWGHGGFIHGFISYSGYDPDSGMRFSLMTSMAGNKETDARKVMIEISSVIRVALHLGSLATVVAHCVSGE